MPSIARSDYHKGLPKAGVKALLDNGLTHIPDRYIKPIDKRAVADEVLCGDGIPVIDMAEFFHNRKAVVDAICDASREWGIFQIINHGVPTSVINGMVEGVLEFFELPIEEKMVYYSEDVFTPVRYCTSMTPSKETHMEWHDHLQHYFPHGEKNHPWPHKPAFYKSTTEKYVNSVSSVAKCLKSALSEGLGLDPDHLERAFGKHEMILRSNYYPPCPNPELALGMNGHSDSGGLTILFEDQVGGLQAKKGDRWYALKPIRNAFIVNIADQIEILSNGKYKSVEHRVTVNSKRLRLSIAAFCSPSSEALIGPIPELLDEQHPPLYKTTLYREHITNVYTKYLDGKHSKNLEK
ncbi:hypothetical protein O6H91_02G073300 [Diphasiastrum complanatum]|uniref:Uncharacterized protein n=1 Tax=Diphasiastrum complanatum TaxID=34168 RepID=A0ACC2EGX8_DIPCM|nr:hypothetical protein O6H91_02G073300 [Diphasiastrum complanatum]